MKASELGHKEREAVIVVDRLGGVLIKFDVQEDLMYKVSELWDALYGLEYELEFITEAPDGEFVGFTIRRVNNDEEDNNDG